MPLNGMSLEGASNSAAETIPLWSLNAPVIRFGLFWLASNFKRTQEMGALLEQMYPLALLFSLC